MKFLIVLFGLVALSWSAPQQRKIFHEHFEDFLEIIMEDAVDELEHLSEHYLEFEEFTASLDYIITANFKEIIYEIEALPEFKAVVEFLEKDSIDINYFINLFNRMLDDFDGTEPRKVRHDLSGTDLSAFIADSIAVFPIDKLQTLYNQKMTDDEDFKTAMDNLYSDEWNQIYGALWNNETFKKEVQVMMDHGIDIQSLLKELKAIFGLVV